VTPSLCSWLIHCGMINYLLANVVALAGLLTGASVVHYIYRPNLV
jgi:hypothetical protein